MSFGSTAQEEYDALCQHDGRFRHVHPAQSGEAAELVPRTLAPVRRRRVEDRTFICSVNKVKPAPPITGRRPPKCATTLLGLSTAASPPHHVRHPLLHGPHRLAIAKIGVQITDSPYVVTNMRIMTRMGTRRARSARRARLLHPLHALDRRPARPRPEGRALALRARFQRKYIVHFPETYEIWSYGSGFGGNACSARSAWRCASPR